ncbi:MAG: MocR-like pyridoxine biosynthesis transcription factor PdxR [Mucilaginibacter sp.]
MRELIKELITINSSADTPVYLQISNAFIQNIIEGRLRTGLKLPGSREIGTLLKVNRMTVVAAFDELNAQGWVEMLPRKGTFIKTKLPLIKPQKLGVELEPFTLPEKTGFVYDEKEHLCFGSSEFPQPGKLIFNDGFPDIRIAPIGQLIKNMRSLSLLPTQKKYLMYGSSQGTLRLRDSLSRFLCDTRGLPASADNILIAKGAQMGLYIASSIILNPGDEVIVGAPGYDTANFTFLQFGAKILSVRVDDEGLDIDAIEKLCMKKKIKLVYVIPHHHNPTTVTLTPERRILLLELASKYKFAIIEDDYDYDFHYASKPMMPMASLDRYGNVIYIGTFTKTLAPSIRFGFIVAPENFIRTAVKVRKLIDTQGDSLMENAIAEMYDDGTIARHIKKSVNLYKERRDHLCNLLKTELGNYISFKIPDGGMSVWASFLSNDLSLISEKAFKKGLIISDGKTYDTNEIKYNSVRLGFASLNFKEQEEAVRILKTVI